MAPHELNKGSAKKRNDVDGDGNDNNMHESNTNNGKNNSDRNNTLWFQEDEQWELTWPIWHMLPHDERKALANKHGYKTIGDFEEYMTLSRAVGDSSEPYDNALLYTTQNITTIEDAKPLAKIKTVPRDEDDESVGGIQEEEVEWETSAQDHLSDDELVEKGGNILRLPEEMIHSVLEWLPVDTYATLALVSPLWKYFTRTEAAYKRLCERSYLNQSKRRTLNVARFEHSYRNMLRNRPRVRAGGGFYVLKYTAVKVIQRDMWTEIPVGAILETVYYRYLYFQENGSVLYALTTHAPHDMRRRLWKVGLTGESDKVVVWGHYQVHKNSVTVVARQEWQTVRLELTIVPNSIPYGRFGCLMFDRHMSSPNDTFDHGGDVVEYKVPDEAFRFLKDKRL